MKMIKLTNSYRGLLILFCGLLLLVCLSSAQANEETATSSKLRLSRIRRQAAPANPNRGRPNAGGNRLKMNFEAGSGGADQGDDFEGQSSASAIASSQSAGGAGTGLGGSTGSNQRPTGRPLATNESPSGGSEFDQSETIPPPPRRRKPARRPPPPSSYQRPNRYDDDESMHNEEDCEDGDYASDYQDFFQMATSPMRHMGRMMNNMFDRMQSSGGNGRGSMASASAFSSGDDYSRLSSAVSNNGRTRGIVSETRNGRTQTRRIGERDSDEGATDDRASLAGFGEDDE